MKKVVISVVATLLVLVCLAQTGLLEIFGIHGISFYTKKKEKDSSAGGAESYTDNQTGISCRFKAEGDYFYIYESAADAQYAVSSPSVARSSSSGMTRTPD